VLTIGRTSGGGRPKKFYFILSAGPCSGDEYPEVDCTGFALGSCDTDFFSHNFFLLSTFVVCAQPCLRKKERKQTTQGRDGRTARRHHTGILSPA